MFIDHKKQANNEESEDFKTGDEYSPNEQENKKDVIMADQDTKLKKVEENCGEGEVIKPISRLDHAIGTNNLRSPKHKRNKFKPDRDLPNSNANEPHKSGANRNKLSKGGIKRIQSINEKERKLWKQS